MSGTVIEAVARSLRPEDWDTIPEGLREEYRIVVRTTISAFADNVSDEMGDIFNEVIGEPKYGEGEHDTLKRAIAAALRASLPQTER